MRKSNSNTKFCSNCDKHEVLFTSYANGICQDHFCHKNDYKKKGWLGFLKKGVIRISKPNKTVCDEFDFKK